VPGDDVNSACTSRAKVVICSPASNVRTMVADQASLAYESRCRPTARGMRTGVAELRALGPMPKPLATDVAAVAAETMRRVADHVARIVAALLELEFVPAHDLPLHRASDGGGSPGPARTGVRSLTPWSRSTSARSNGASPSGGEHVLRDSPNQWLGMRKADERPRRARHSGDQRLPGRVEPR
jgi:hypothetical protein